MWSEEKIQDYLKKNLRYKRYEHSLGVKDTAVKLAETYKLNIEKAKIAGLVHDCAKNMNDEQILEIALKHDIKINDVCKESPQLLHGAVGAVLAKEIMGIDDKEILDAITYHTTGRKNMSMIDKVIYIADYIEPLRNFPGVEELREVAFKDIDKALLKSFDNTIKFVIDRKQLLHFDTIEARNHLISIK
ncbi:bis(5'-nucleosyl)-tetraphosphatase (symmetrical) YqeK [Clostridiaceae bacterium UIB06]|uniref:bis(5'-nucleosyl)-tetraphosphatase (symmetrical) n=1 Tax=Clostridium thailandense TaxID=2794346 RepID=A0A949TTF4_9CLOT|nr:bis(5'-nucleosyl)-tetraphosphatase (symmetrical) YqeK [Clostridium thailandense]MBV7273056.1 bis(5'-nucleosyl)-tetraphosphatase (symmetrical) YqeK [Clostridium thailandense]MCH5135720.1 bis(5'-nucleosyl)-tetraphosphatase (symmetrical) YqeK [Clostridiaceae bacterium UIB06]